MRGGGATVLRKEHLRRLEHRLQQRDMRQLRVPAPTLLLRQQVQREQYLHRQRVPPVRISQSALLRRWQL
jgi:hypothetical protein